MYSHIWNIGYVMVSFIALAVCDQCTDRDIDLCWQPMWDLPDHLTWTSIVPTLPEDDMRHHCELFDEVEECLNDLERHCDILDVKSHEGIISAYDFLCHESFEEYLEHRECFANTDLHNEGTHCNETLVRKLDSLNDEKSTEYKFNRICQYANDYLDCVENAVDSFCGDEAANWQRTMDIKNIQPILHLAGCQLDGNTIIYYSPEHKTRTYIIIGCIAVISLIMILMAVSLLMIYRTRKQRPPYIDRRVNYTSNSSGGGVTMVNSTANGNTAQQAGPLPQKFPEPPPYHGDVPPPVYTTPSDYMTPVSNNYEELRGEGGAGASVISAPPSYVEKPSAPPPGSRQGSERLGVDNPVYHDFSKDD